MFKVGDKVRCTSGKEDLTQGNSYVIAGFWGRDEPYVIDDAGDERSAQRPWFELVNAVRTVTKREIVPGVYGRVEVIEHDVCYGVHIGLVHKNCYMTAEELREAAHLFNQIAEVLEDASN